MSKIIIAGLLATLLAGCATESPCVPVYDSEGRLVHTNTCMKGTTQDTAGAVAGGVAAVAAVTLGIVALTR
ncbi:outer membrane protein [Enterobacterales bacterium]|nr:outer membrane protein [Enterobacterales bacterium]